MSELNELEYLCFAVGQPFNIAAMLSIKGTISITLLKATLKKLQKKHPLLKARLTFDEKKRPWFTSEKVKEIPFSIIEREKDSQVLNEFDKQLLTAFDLTNEELPLFRMVLFSSPEKSDLIFCSMHVISDGLSMTFLVVDFIRYMINQNEPIMQISFPKRDIDIFPPKIKKMIPKTKIFSYFVYFFLSSYNFLRYAFLGKAKNPKINLKENEIEIYSWIFNSKQTKQFIERCKEEKVSVHAALCTAFLPNFRSIASSVNLRERLKFPIGKSFGFYSSAIVLNKRYKKTLSFWENVRRYQKTLNRYLKDRIVFLPLKLFNKKASYALLRKIGVQYVGIVS